MRVVHVVKRYGPVGGMERYVWELTHALLDQDVQITVVCERAHEVPDERIELIELGETRPKPRWLSMLRFSRRVTQLARERGWQEDPEVKIHSHERTGVHDFTTFHGPPMAPIKQRKRLWWLSPRLIAWLWLEWRELCRPGVTVLPNSELIRKKLQSSYPSMRMGITAWPGTKATTVPDIMSVEGVVFVGREYRRKGLPKLIEIMERLREKNLLPLTVVGAEQDPSLFRLISDREWIVNIPWVANLNVREFGHVLVHPAIDEPYGMAIAEAMVAGVECVVSDQCGMKDHYPQVMVVPLDASVDDWAAAVATAASRDSKSVAPYTWENLAADTLTVYRA